jgi:glutathione synthase/RimK-type ligase-like ATP-grasp enzyme
MKFALLTAIVTEENFNPYHYEFKEIASKMGHSLDLFKNGEFSIAYGNNKELIELNREPFDPSIYDAMINRMSIKDSHTGNYYIIDAFNNASVPYFNNIYSVIRAKNKFSHDIIASLCKKFLFRKLL